MTAAATTKPAKPWTFTSDSCGYMLFKDGEPQGGAGTLSTASHTGDGKLRHWQHRKADIKMFREQGQRQCDMKNAEADGDERDRARYPVP